MASDKGWSTTVVCINVEFRGAARQWARTSGPSHAAASVGAAVGTGSMHAWRFAM